MIEAEAFIEALRASGHTFFSGVPCSFLKPFINYVIDDASLDYVGAASEGEAVGITMGAYLGGRKTVTMCQNSGLGNMVNPLTSLNQPFRIPTLVISTWRGEPGVKDEPQHEQMGRILPALFDTLEIPWKMFPREIDQIAPTLTVAETSMRDRQLPFGLIMAKDSVAPHGLKRNPEPVPVSTDRRHCGWNPTESRLTRTEALDLILENLRGDEAVIATTGKTGRELFTIADRPNHLYVVGGMGTASAIGLGLAQVRPDQTVVVIDGDGAALMKLGAMATVGFQQPKNLIHIILDNEQHDSTGGQRTSSGIVSFADVAAATNYRNAFSADAKADVAECLRDLRDRPGASLLHVKIRPGSPKELGRPTVKPHEVKERFMGFVNQAAS